MNCDSQRQAALKIRNHLTTFISMTLILLCSSLDANSQGFPEQTLGADEMEKVEVIDRSGKVQNIHYSTNEDGLAIYQGDIILIQSQRLRTMSTDEISVQSKSIAAILGLEVIDRSKLWPNGEIFYWVDPNLPNPNRVTRAVQHWQDNTDLVFTRLTDVRGDVIVFQSGRNCASPLGYQEGPQPIYLSEFCDFGHVVHEIGHALGLQHEHAREDQEAYIRILHDNIIPGKEANFYPDPFKFRDAGEYCYDSIMHYPADAFSINPPSAKTIDPLIDVRIGQRNKLALCDIQTIGALYAQEIGSRP